MSKRAHPDTNDAVAKARAAIAAKYAKLSEQHKSPKPLDNTSAPKSVPSTQQTKQEPPGRSTGIGLSADLQRRIDEAKAASLRKVQTARVDTAPDKQFDPRGGLDMTLHPALQNDLVLANKRNSQRSQFASTLANRKPEEVKVIAKSKRLELLSGPDQSYTDREQNPYYDPKLGGRDTTRPIDRRSKALQFSEPGKYIAQANQVREEEALKAFKARIAASARRAGLEDDLHVSGRAIAKDEPPEIEWWDEPYTTNKTYDDIQTNSLKIMTSDSPITNMIQHPIPRPAPFDLNAPVPAPVMYTKKEHKKIRNQERAAKLKDKQDKQRLGLMAPDQPKVKLSNMATVLAHSVVKDPTRVEREVLAQVQARKDQHEQTNEERKLTHEEKKAKAAEKLAEDEAKGIKAVAWRVEIMANAYHRRRVDENAQQCGLTGVVILNPRFNLVYVEGGAKSIKFFKKLMESRIEWTEGPRSMSAETESQVDYGANKCTCVWEGDLRKRTLGNIRFRKCEYEVDVKDALREEVYNLWNIAKFSKED